MAGTKVMIIDDNKEFSEELGETLYLCGYEVVVVSVSANALEVARNVKPVVILLDLRMAGSNGFQVAQKLKETPETSGIPIIAMSGYFPIEDKSVLLDMHNMDARINKPFSISQIITEIEEVLNKTGAGDPRSEAVNPLCKYEYN